MTGWYTPVNCNYRFITVSVLINIPSFDVNEINKKKKNAEKNFGIVRADVKESPSTSDGGYCAYHTGKASLMRHRFAETEC